MNVSSDGKEEVTRVTRIERLTSAAKEAAVALHDALEGEAEEAEKLFIDTLALAADGQVKAICSAYEDEYDQSLKRSIDKVFDGAAQSALARSSWRCGGCCWRTRRTTRIPATARRSTSWEGCCCSSPRCARRTRFGSCSRW